MTVSKPEVAMRCAAATIGFMLLSACGDGSVVHNQANPAPTPTPAQPAIDGYKDIKFGSSFEDAIGKFGGDLFNSAAVSDCFKDIPLKGCSLMRNTNNTPFDMKEGIPYTLSLSFNRKDKLTDIGLNYDRENDISREQCLEIHDRTLDWLINDYGPMRGNVAKPEAGITTRSTHGKNSYQIWMGEDQSFITQPVRTVSTGMIKQLERQPIMKWDKQRYVTLMSTFIVVDGNPICNINADFKEPDGVERAPSMNTVS